MRHGLFLAVDREQIHRHLQERFGTCWLYRNARATYALSSELISTLLFASGLDRFLCRPTDGPTTAVPRHDDSNLGQQQLR
jgi:hypothetical protein